MFQSCVHSTWENMVLSTYKKNNQYWDDFITSSKNVSEWIGQQPQVDYLCITKGLERN